MQITFDELQTQTMSVQSLLTIHFDNSSNFLYHLIREVLLVKSSNTGYAEIMIF